MALSKPPADRAGLTCSRCAWAGHTGQLNKVEGYSCPNCGEPLFPPEWEVSSERWHRGAQGGAEMRGIGVMWKAIKSWFEVIPAEARSMAADEMTKLEKARTDYALLTNDYEALAYEVMELRALVGEKTLALKSADIAHSVGRREIKRCRNELKALRLVVENIKSECVQGRCDEKTFAMSERILAIARSQSDADSKPSCP